MSSGTLKIALVTGCVDPHYQLDLISGIVAQGIEVDLIGDNDMEYGARQWEEQVRIYNFGGNQRPGASLMEKIRRILRYYLKLTAYAAKTKTKIFHLQWPYKFEFFDRTLLNIYYKILGKKLIFTAHNVDAGIRDGKSTRINRLSLLYMYRCVDHIIVHTEKMKIQLVEEFNVSNDKISVVPYGVTNAVPKTQMTGHEARKSLGIRDDEKVMLFFGNITPYKGLEYLITALKYLRRYENLRLIIAGKVGRDRGYLERIRNLIHEEQLGDRIVMKIGFVPDSDIEVYFKTADVLVLPYKYIFQSGVLFMAYAFGLPVVAADVGSLREDVVEGETGYLCTPQDPRDLASKLELYFESDLFRDLDSRRSAIGEYAQEKYSWGTIGARTKAVYESLL
jgi:D-inositol-3-phosphate glycosyltransferase